MSVEIRQLNGTRGDDLLAAMIAGEPAPNLSRSIPNAERQPQAIVEQAYLNLAPAPGELTRGTPAR